MGVVVIAHENDVAEIQRDVAVIQFLGVAYFTACPTGEAYPTCAGWALGHLVWWGDERWVPAFEGVAKAPLVLGTGCWAVPQPDRARVRARHVLRARHASPLLGRPAVQ